MNAELMVKIQNLIYFNQDNLDKVLSVLEEGLVEKTLLNPEDEYVVSEKDVGSLCYFKDFNNVFDKNSVLGMLMSYDKNPKCFEHESSDGDYYEFAKPYTGPIKLHFKPFAATENSVKPDDCGDNYALLMSDGEIIMTCNSLPEGLFKKGYRTERDVIGYCPLSFVNPILDK